jgi:fatty acid desaturase
MSQNQSAPSNIGQRNDRRLGDPAASRTTDPHAPRTAGSRRGCPAPTCKGVLPASGERTEILKPAASPPSGALGRRELGALIHPYRFLDNHTNFFYLAVDYATLIAVLSATIAFCHLRAAWGIAWYWTIPLVGLAVLAVGAIQHRLAGLGHEGAHYILFRNRLLNELVSDLLCMFPIFSTTQQYRQIHLGHHEFVNDWQRDPELINLGKTRMMDAFPMTRSQFIFNFGLRLFWPPTLLRYMWDNIYVTALGCGIHPYMKEQQRAPTVLGRIRLTSLLGIMYVALMVGVLGWLSYHDSTALMIVAPLALYGAALLVIALLPTQWFFSSRLKPVYSPKVASALRLGFLTVLEYALALSHYLTGVEWGVYFWLLWMLPLFTAFPYFMLLRDLFQHANADMGKLTNSRVAFCNPLLRWAMFIYGQDIHLTHHLYPAVPHYHLRELHEMLMERSAEYRRHVVECHGTLTNPRRLPSLLDVISRPAHS